MHAALLALSPRYITWTVSAVALVVFLALSTLHWIFLLGVAAAALLTWLGYHDITQTQHSILRNYPIAGHLRFLLENVRAEIRQYFLENDIEGTPFSRNKRAVVYQRAKGQLDKRPFGTQLDVYAASFEWLNHSMTPKHPNGHDFRVTIGGPDCTKPYNASLFNISAMSFGALSANAISALNRGARHGGFAHDTGEGGLSPYHRDGGGDIIWEIGSGYFGCRDLDGHFSPEAFESTAKLDQVKMVEIKLSQGAKPGHGGVLPGAKVSQEIAATRGVSVGLDCISPSAHSAFSSPRGLLDFIAELRRLSGGKPVGFKLCVGHRWEFLALCKAMLETGITPDFIVVDGAEGGTGAAPLEFTDHIGMPMREGLNFVHNALIGCGLRDRIRLGASGKIASAFDIARAMALGADWCNSARGFMFALGCIQSLSCHTDHCPTGVATQDRLRQRALVVTDKAARVSMFHNSTLRALAEVVAAAGLDHPNQLRTRHLSRRISQHEIVSYDVLYPTLEPGELLRGTERPDFAKAWAMAEAGSFAEVGTLMPAATLVPAA
ncbi:MAG: FMN-binding glutamate synthase family protein [Ancalomicrobiaceae bacterium]|nr:FMN-binding glutamate synthase family protein [Ancalomicrobiaceae bacterium]